MQVYYFIFLLFFSSCKFFPAPGEGNKAKKSFKVCNEIIHALEDFKKSKGQYPNNLEILFPKYIGKIPLKSLNGFDLKYLPNKAKEKFSLRFAYSGPGFNWCDYSSKEKKWICGGAY